MGEVFERRRRWFSVGVDAVILLAVFGAAGIWFTSRAEVAPAPAGSAVGQSWPVDSAPQGPFLAYIFRTDCPVCTTQKPNWMALAHTAESLGVSVVALSPETMAPHVASYFDDLGLISIQQLQPEHLGALGVQQVPTTLFVDERGLVTFQQVGVFSMSAAELAEIM